MRIQTANGEAHVAVHNSATASVLLFKNGSTFDLWPAECPIHGATVGSFQLTTSGALKVGREQDSNPPRPAFWQCGCPFVFCRDCGDKVTKRIKRTGHAIHPHWSMKVLCHAAGPHYSGETNTKEDQFWKLDQLHGHFPSIPIDPLNPPRKRKRRGAADDERVVDYALRRLVAGVVDAKVTELAGKKDVKELRRDLDDVQKDVCLVKELLDLREVMVLGMEKEQRLPFICIRLTRVQTLLRLIVQT